MPAKPQPTSFRLTPDEIADLDFLGVELAPEGGSPLDRTEVLRVLVRRAKAQLAKKNPQKTRTRD